MDIWRTYSLMDVKHAVLKNYIHAHGIPYNGFPPTGGMPSPHAIAADENLHAGR